MKRSVKIVALALGSLLMAATFAACGGKGNTPTAPTSFASARICYDNLGGASSYLAEKNTKAVAKGATDIVGYNKEGTKVDDYKTIAAYDGQSGTFTAVSEGRITCTIEGNVGYTLEVVPAYVTDPGNQYKGTINDWNIDLGQSVLGNTHDPSFIESRDSKGNVSYYLFSTGWDKGNDVHVSYDGMLTWEYVGKTTQPEDYDNETVLPAELKAWMNASNNTGDISWWAPDIVEAPGGGYWFYTCLTMSEAVQKKTQHSGVSYSPSGSYTQACIVMYHIDSLENIGSEGAVEYKGVLMQSAIPVSSGGIDVNGIDPQIIYTPDGKMYMAYGSFGTGNWMIELDPATGLRKDGDNTWHEWDWVRRQRNKVVSDDEQKFESPSAANTECGKKVLSGEGYAHPYYGTMLSVGAMEAPVLARHDNVKIFDETTEDIDAVEGKTYYYSMHSYNGLAAHYQMWGGRSENVTGLYRSTGGGYVYNNDVGASSNQGNKYMGGFEWQASSKASSSKDYASCLTGHNDLYTAKNGVNMAAYIVRDHTATGRFLVQTHQYYLNSKGDICISPNRYGGEIDRAVSEDELFALTDGGKFEMVVLTNSADWTGGNNIPSGDIRNVSRTVTLNKDTHKILDGATEIGSWVMYGDGYIKFTFDAALKGSGSYNSNETVYYGVVRPAWLANRNQSGFTITCMGNTAGNKQNMAMFMNSYSTIELD